MTRPCFGCSGRSDPTGSWVGHTAGSFYIDDKAGSSLNLLRWISPRTIKETFVPATDYRYPFMG